MPYLSDFYISNLGALTLPVNTVTYNDGGTTNLDYFLGNVFSLTANGTGTMIGHLNAPSERYSFELHLQWISGTITWPTSWTKGDTAPTTTGGYVITGTTVDGGISWKISVLVAPSGIVTDGLVLHLDAGQYDSYPGSGTTWTDLAGSNDGTIFNNPTFSSSVGGTFSFNGSTHYISGTNPVTGQVAVTLEAWVRSTDTGSFRTPVNTMLNGSQTGVSIQQRNNGTFWLAVGTWGVTSDVVTASYTVNQWTHWALTCNGSNIIGYKNGANAGSTASNRTLTYGALTVGRGAVNAVAPGEYFLGDIASVRLYNRALSAAEIEQNFEATRGRFGI